MIEDSLTQELAELATAGLTRRRRVLDSPAGRIATVDGKQVLNFASNDYLGLAGNAEIARALADGALQWGAGSGASHLVSGHLTPHDRLENEIAAFTGFERALTFSTGYLANIAVTPTFAGRGDAVFADKLNHASLIDAMQLAKSNGADVQRYPHNDVAALERQLAASSATRKVIVTDAVYSMDGDLAPLPAIHALAERYDAWLVIDDAHGFRRSRPAWPWQPQPFQPAGIAGASCSWAPWARRPGSVAPFVAGSATAIEYLLQKGRSYIFTTAAPPAIACALSKSLQIIGDGDALRANLMARIAQLRDGLAGRSAAALRPPPSSPTSSATTRLPALPCRKPCGSAACGRLPSARQRFPRARPACAFPSRRHIRPPISTNCFPP